MGPRKHRATRHDRPRAGLQRPARSPKSSRPGAAATPLEHKATAPKSVGCFVLTVSDTKTPETDTSGALIRDLLTKAGHQVAHSAIVRDEPTDVARIVREACARAEVQAVIVTGGTGITSRDSTYEAIEALLDKRLPGFGELFRMLSFQEIGAAAMLSRAQMGLHARRIVVSLPGSPNACRLALEKLVIPELGHLLREASR
jgi:molybdopterin adenylyltransferase